MPPKKAPLPLGSVVSTNSHADLPAKVEQVREVFPKESYEKVQKLLVSFDGDVAKVIQTLTEGLGDEALDEWSDSKKKGPKAPAKKAAAAAAAPAAVAAPVAPAAPAPVPAAAAEGGKKAKIRSEQKHAQNGGPSHAAAPLAAAAPHAPAPAPVLVAPAMTVAPVLSAAQPLAVQQAMQAVNDMHAATAESWRAAEQTVNTAFAQLHQVLVGRQQSLMQEMQRAFNEEVSLVEGRKQFVTNMASSFQAASSMSLDPSPLNTAIAQFLAAANAETVNLRKQRVVADLGPVVQAVLSFGHVAPSRASGAAPSPTAAAGSAHKGQGHTLVQAHAPVHVHAPTLPAASAHHPAHPAVAVHAPVLVAPSSAAKVPAATKAPPAAPLVPNVSVHAPVVVAAPAARPASSSDVSGHVMQTFVVPGQSAAAADPSRLQAATELAQQRALAALSKMNLGGAGAGAPAEKKEGGKGGRGGRGGKGGEGKQQQQQGDGSASAPAAAAPPAASTTNGAAAPSGDASGAESPVKIVRRSGGRGGNKSGGDAGAGAGAAAGAASVAASSPSAPAAAPAAAAPSGEGAQPQRERRGKKKADTN